MNMNDPQQQDTEASILEMVLECNQTETLGDGDSFSTLGLHSIFSEDDCRSTVDHKKEGRTHTKKKTKGAAIKSRGTPFAAEKIMENVVEEGGKGNSGAPDESGMNLRTLLGIKAQSFRDSSAPRADLPAGGGHAPLFQGNRWLESASQSVSCRNFSYEVGGDADDTMVLEQRFAKTCREIVSQALELTDPSPPAFSRMGLSTSCRDLCSHAEKLDAPPSGPTRGRWVSRVGMAQSCRHLNVRAGEDGGVVTHSPPLSPGGATAKARNSRLKRASSSGRPSNSPEKRKTMITVGKSLSARNVMDTSDLSVPARITVRSKSVRHLSSRSYKCDDRSVSDEDLPLSPFVRSKRLSSRDLKVPPAAPSLNGRRFVSYSRSLSCKDIDLKNEEPESPSHLTSSPQTNRPEVSLPPVTRNGTRHCRVNTSDAGLVKIGSLSGFLEKTNRGQQTPSLVSNSRRAFMAKSKSARHFPDGRVSMLSIGKSLSARNLTEADADSLPTLSPMTSGTKSPAVLRSMLSSVKPPLKTEADIASIPSLSTMSVSAATKSPAPIRTKLFSATPLAGEVDAESLPSLAPMTPVKASPAVVRPAWSPSTAAVPEISAPPLAEEEKNVETTEVQTPVDAVITEELTNQVSSNLEKEARPVFSTEEIRKEVGSLHMKDLFLSPIREVCNKGRPSGRLASTRASQSCRRLSSTKKEPSQRSLKSSSEHGRLQRSARHGMKKDGSRRKLGASSLSHGLDASKHGTSRRVTQGSRERPSPEKQRSSRNLRKSSRKQVSCRKLMATHSEDSSEANRRPARNSIKREKSNRTVNSASSSHRRRQSRSQRESRETSPNCVSSYTPEKKSGSSPRSSHRRLVRASSKRDCSSRSMSKRSSLQRALNASFKAEEVFIKEAERSNLGSNMRDWNSSFRKRCSSFQGTSSASDVQTPEIVW